MQFQYLNAEMAEALWGAGSGNPAVCLHPAEQPRLLWLNARAAVSDPVWQTTGGDLAAYGAHLLATCARLISYRAGNSSTPPSAIGYADRYGGAGIGRNGGSGRAVVVDGYHIKGVGRTPLVSTQTSPEHASGGAYFEECVRETIHSELVSAEFPHGAIPVLAIIDTGLVQVWETGGVPKRERRCLLVRPAFVRPAHLERAVGYLADNPHSGMDDIGRVRHAFAWLRCSEEQRGLAATLTQFACRWATQLAYGFVHRISHGGHNTSNICLDGALVDFGASTALPSWAKTRIIPGGQVFGHEFAALKQALTPALYYWARFGDATIGQPAFEQHLMNLAAQDYNRTIMVEVLRLVGLTRRRAVQILESPRNQELGRAIGGMVRHFQQDRLDILEHTPSPNRAWDLAAFWSDCPPQYARQLRAILADGRGQGMRPDEMDAAARRCRLLQSTRTSLFREESKRAIFHALEGEQAGAPSLSSVTSFIHAQVARARRDSVHEFDDAVPAGFAVGATGSYALFTDTADGSLFAVDEDRSRTSSGGMERVLVSSWTCDEVTIGSAGLPMAAAVYAEYAGSARKLTEAALGATE